VYLCDWRHGTEYTAATEQGLCGYTQLWATARRTMEILVCEGNARIGVASALEGAARSRAACIQSNREAERDDDERTWGEDEVTREACRTRCANASIVPWVFQRSLSF
jgi:hypothetical protein